MVEEDDNFRSRDLYLCAFLLASDMRLIDLDRTDPGRVRFVFANRERCEECVDAYWQGAKVVARDMVTAVRTLKERLYSDY